MSTTVINRCKGALKPLETDDSGGSGRMVSVVILNDDVTPIDYVLEALMTVFKLNLSASTQTAVKAHRTGSALVGMYPETKAEQLLRKLDAMNRSNGYGLRCVILDVET